MKAFILALTFLPSLAFAAPRRLIGDPTKDLPATNLNFQDIDNERNNFVRKQSTETITGYKTFTGMSVSTISVTSATVTAASISTLNGISLSGLVGFGKVNQVVIGSVSTSSSTTSTSFIDTGLSVSITPVSSSSRIFVIVMQAVGGVFSAASNTVIVDIRLLRNGSVISGPVSLCHFTNLAASSEIGFVSSFAAIDSPATTSAITYKTQFARNSAANAVTHRVQKDGTLSTIIAIELLP